MVWFCTAALEIQQARFLQPRAHGESDAIKKLPIEALGMACAQ
jgi:hypothetical protein